LSEIDQLNKAIEMLEAQRPVLGDIVIDAAVAPLRQKLATIQQQSVSEQRKLVTVLFADLVGFTQLAEQMDPEDVREVLQAYFKRWSDCIEQYGGTVEKFIGDAVMAVFGLHTAREDDSERALHAAITMRQSLEELNQQLARERGLQLSVRVGIHTGQVVISLLGERKGQDFVVVGDTVNLASRLQNLAPPGGILITEDTFRLVRGVFDIRALEPVQVKGKRSPVPVYLVVQAKPRSMRRERQRQESPLVGREAIIETLTGLANSTIYAGQGHVAVLLGESGMGKTRILDELEYRLDLMPEPIRFFIARASPYLVNQPYAFLRDLLTFRFQIQDDDSPAVVRFRLEKELGEPFAAALVGAMLGFPIQIEPPLDAQQLRDRARVALLEYFQKLAAADPVVVVLDDLQWADDSSFEMLTGFQQELAHLPILWIVTGRPELLERDPFWTAKEGSPADTGVTRMDIGPLSAGESLALVEALLAETTPVQESSGLAAPAELQDLVIRSADGNPYFIEELLHMLIEDEVVTFDNGIWQVQSERLTGVHIPPSLTEFLQARLDSLVPEARALLQRAAVVGRIFWDSAVEHLYSSAAGASRFLANETISVMLDQLLAQQIIIRLETSTFEGTRAYRFTHSLFRDVAYESLLRRQRKMYHLETARWIEGITERGQRSAEFSALIAEHYARGDAGSEAGQWYRLAGQFAADRFANVEAEHNYTRALELLEPKDLEGRFTLLLDREKIYERTGDRAAQAADIEAMAQLVEALADNSAHAEAALRRANLAFLKDDTTEAVQLAQGSIPLADKSGDLRLIIAANLLAGRTLLWNNQHDEAEQQLRRTLELTRTAQMEDQEAECLWNIGVAACNKGEFSTASQMLDEALVIFRRLNNLSGEAVVMGQQGVVYYSAGDFDRAKESFEGALVPFQAMGHRTREATMLNNLGAIASEQSNFSGSYRLQTRALSLYKAAEDKYGIVTTSNNMADNLRDVGLYEQAMVYYKLSLDTLATTNDRFIETSLRSSLCRFYSLQSDFPSAIREGEMGVSASNESGAVFYRSYVLGRLAAAYTLAGRLKDAERIFNEAIAVQEQLGLADNVIESKAGLARVALLRSDLPAAQELVEVVLRELENNPLRGCDDPSRIYLTLYQVLLQCGDPRAGQVLQAGFSELEERSLHIDDEAMRQTFLDNIPINQELLALRRHAAASS
jgi:class 3 adenylate cyclase/tetratricopeptide (TPR) repeat protein